jgi:hypothetical protein
MLALAGCGFVGPDNPSDDYVRELFAEHKASLEELADMMAAETEVYFVHIDGRVGSSGEEDLSEERLQAYLDLMNEVGVECVQEEYGDIEITLFSEGNVAESFTLGLVRAETVNTNELAETTYDTVDDNTTRYAHIEDDWYVYRVHD